MKRARVTGQSATLHRWRKEVNTHWDQLRLKADDSGSRPLLPNSIDWRLNWVTTQSCRPGGNAETLP